MSELRKIIHVDMDAFYASVEQRDFPELRGIPVAVGGSSKRGVVAAASYEARAFGVRSAMSSALAARRCPGLVFVPARFDVYRSVSKQIRAIFHRFTDTLEPLSLDEAYLDVTHPLARGLSATEMARRIRAMIRVETGLTASAGVSYNKFLAKVASDFEKPDGLTVIRPRDALAFIAALPVEKFHGVGPVTARRMHDLGIKTGLDLRQFSEEELTQRFGKAGRYYHRVSRGLDDRPVSSRRGRKSLGAERTFDTNLTAAADMMDRLQPIAEKVAYRLHEAGLAGNTVTLKIKTSDFKTSTRQVSTGKPLHDAEEILEVVALLLHNAPSPPVEPVRLLGITISHLHSLTDGLPPEQLRLDLGGP
jgi:DNA polymerase-4